MVIDIYKNSSNLSVIGTTAPLQATVLGHHPLGTTIRHRVIRHRVIRHLHMDIRRREAPHEENGTKKRGLNK